MICSRISCKRVNQSNVRAFRRFNWAYSTVVSRVYVTHFEACSFSRETTWPKSRYATLVSNLGQRVILIHELGKLTGAKEFLDRCSHWLRIDHILRHQTFRICHAQALFHCAFDTNQPNTKLVLGHLTNRANTAVT